MKKFKDFYEAWWFLTEHPMFSYNEDTNDKLNFDGSFLQCLDITVQKINPKTEMIDENEELNTKTKIWLESGGYMFDEHVGGFISCHDLRLDCDGDTFEKAIINLANLVKKYYGKK